ncbi:MAG: membrane metalloprotease [Flavobacterium sp. BFFFF1]|uniref:membrane metalloprotease n=1 Tax=Flavobacterium sp. BFFFF1 TaxID=2015557 RepID=UPI000BD92BD8|nr:membrane metalloprotease [Flavobacterium sp. BFFFF1]OYU79778.1 MAG: membrane metalloprotease [Flavobacterium sp. BFFFF1]
MKKLQLLSIIFLFVIWGCSNEESNSAVEDGTNPAPNLKATGSSANDFLSADKYSSLVIEVFYVGDLQPNAQTLQNLKQFMQARLHKPGGITIEQKQISSPQGTPYTINEIADLESEIRTRYNSEDTLALFVLFVDGNFSSDTNTTLTLGAAYRNTSCVLFENSIRTLSNSPTEPNRTDLETIVILHELCHILGLVDLGSPMQTDHLDAAHGKHCSNQNCLMYYETESNIQNMMQSGMPALDADCLADLKANGGR